MHFRTLSPRPLECGPRLLLIEGGPRGVGQDLYRTWEMSFPQTAAHWKEHVTRIAAHLTYKRKDMVCMS